MTNTYLYVGLFGLPSTYYIQVEELSVQKDLLLGKQKEFLTLKQELDDLKLTVSEESKVPMP